MSCATGFYDRVLGLDVYNYIGTFIRFIEFGWLLGMTLTETGCKLTSVTVARVNIWGLGFAGVAVD